MATPVNSDWIESCRAAALAYLRDILRERAPDALASHRAFESSPLEGEGPTVLFEFTLPSPAGIPDRFFVAAGQTESNYYPALDLSFEDAFALHLGTRFMLVLQVGVASEAVRSGIDLAKRVRELVDSVGPGESISELELAAAFDVEGQCHAVARCRIGPQAAYAFIGDAPPGFSTAVHHPPQVAYRIHLGRALLAEAEQRGATDDVDEPDPET